MAGKTCTKCGVEKPLGDFYFHKSGKRAGKPMSTCKLCNRAYQRQKYARRKSGELATMRVVEQECGTCGIVKPAVEYTIDHARPNGLKRYCKPCMKARWLQERYGLTTEAYEAMPKTCETCGATDGLVIDHDHMTGAVRGILCDSCNVALGRIKDDPDVALALAFYLVRTRNVIGEMV